MTNLDYLCAKYGQNIPKSKDDRNIIQNALGVLQEDGLFAFVLYLEEQEGSEDVAGKIKEKSNKLLRKAFSEAADKSLRENMVEIIEENLDKMFLSKKVLEKMLVYAKHRSQAKE